MFKVKTIVLSICGAFAIGGCASFDQIIGHAEKTSARAQADMSAAELYQAGREYQAQVQYDRAIESYLKAIERDHAMADAHNALGVAYAEQGRYDEAIAEIKAAIELKPGEAYMHNNLGYAYLLSGADREALNPLEIALQLEPGNKRAAFNLRLAHERLGDLPQSDKVPPHVDSGSPQTPAADRTPVAQVSDPRLVAVGPGIYELKLATRNGPEIATLRQAAFEESSLAQQQSQPVRRFRLEVSNGNGTPGLARQVARVLSHSGVHANRITNHATFRQVVTQIQYRPGYLAEASSLRNIVPGEIKAVPSTVLRSDIQVRVLLGKDASRIAKAAPRFYAEIPAAHTTPVASR